VGAAVGAGIDPRLLFVGTLLLLAVLVVGTVTLLTGTIELTVGEVVAAVFGQGDDRTLRTVQGRRLPRLLTALLVGGSLGVAGSVFQSLSRNALGSPDIIGFTTGAATGAVVQIVLFDGGVVQVAMSAIAGGVLTALVVYTLARKDGITGGMRLVLVGIGVGAILAAVTSFLVVRADINDAETVQRWEAGSLIGRGWPHAVSVAVAVAVLLPAIMVCARRITYVEMGDDSAHALGIPVETYRFAVLVIAVTLTGVAVAATGPIAFIALAAPQIVRRITRRGGVIVIPSFLMGAALLACADLITQRIDFGMPAPVGLVTSVIGGVYLIWLLARRA
jgi:iron complex transport system permease protein